MIKATRRLAVILATCAPWNRAPSSSTSDGWRDSSPLIMVVAHLRGDSTEPRTRADDDRIVLRKLFCSRDGS